jgi:transposase
MNASQAAEHLGISRKTYYKWAQRALSAMSAWLTNQRPGRPSHPVDREKQALEKQLQQARRNNELLKHKMALKDVLTALKLDPDMDRVKKNERIEKAMAMIAELKKTYSVSNSVLAHQFSISYTTLMR